MINQLKAEFLWIWPSLVLGTLGVAQIQTILSGQALALVHPSFHLYIFICGLLLIALAVVRLCLGQASSQAPSWGRLGRQLMSGGVLAGAMILALKVAPANYSELAFNNRGLLDQAMPTMSPKYAEGTVDKIPPAGELLDCEVVDLLMAASDAEMVKNLEGHRVRMIGQVMPVDAKSFSLVRMMMYCCAADAQPVGMNIAGPSSGLPRMGWVEVQGQVHFIPSPPVWKVELKLDKIVSTPAPKDIFLY